MDNKRLCMLLVNGTGLRLSHLDSCSEVPNAHSNFFWKVLASTRKAKWPPSSVPDRLPLFCPIASM